jgi:hypothetical protein
LRTQRTYKLLLLIPAIWASLFDIGITIINQPKEYWSGNLDKANEGNPIGGFLMKNHVSGLFVISFIWLIIIGLVGYYLPRKYSRIFLLFILIIHSYGASSWLSQFYGFWYAIAFMLFNAILFYIIEDFANRKGIVESK